MSNQKLTAFEKTSIQARHSIKRLEVFRDNMAITEEDKLVAEQLLEKFHEIRKLIPSYAQDVDLNDRE